MSTGIKQLDVEPKFILEVASGIREPAEIATDYGYSPDEWLSLQQFDPFIKAVELKKEELRASGYTFRMKSAFIAEELLDKLYCKATEQGASFHTTLELAKFTARAAGLESPAKEQSQSGPGFSITINLGGGQTVQIGATQPLHQVQDITDVEDLSFDFSMAFPAYKPTPLPSGE